MVMDRGVISLMEWLGDVGPSLKPSAIPLFNPIIPFWHFGVTSILAFSIGSMAYALLVALPFMMLRLLGHFLP
jgi:hypothetical protein